MSDQEFQRQTALALVQLDLIASDLDELIKADVMKTLGLEANCPLDRLRLYQDYDGY